MDIQSHMGVAWVKRYFTDIHIDGARVPWESLDMHRRIDELIHHSRVTKTSHNCVRCVTMVTSYDAKHLL